MIDEAVRTHPTKEDPDGREVAGHRTGLKFTISGQPAQMSGEILHRDLGRCDHASSLQFGGQVVQIPCVRFESRRGKARLHPRKGEKIPQGSFKSGW